MNTDDDNTSIWGRSAKGRAKAAVHSGSDDDTAWPRRRQRRNSVARQRT